MATHHFNCFAMLLVAFDDCYSIIDFVCLRIWSHILQVWSHQAGLMIKTEAMLMIQVKQIKIHFLKHSQESLNSLMTELQMHRSLL